MTSNSKSIIFDLELLIRSKTKCLLLSNYRCTFTVFFNSTLSTVLGDRFHQSSKLQKFDNSANTFSISIKIDLTLFVFQLIVQILMLLIGQTPFNF